MGISVSGQMIEAALALLIGIAGGFYYDVLRAVRRSSGNGVVTILLDLMFWLVLGAALFIFGLTLGGGRQRVFVVIFAFLGGWLYFLTLSRYALWLCESVLELIRFVLLCIAAPFVFSVSQVKKTGIFLKNVFSYHRKRCKIKGYVNNPVVDPLTALWSDL